MMVKRCALIALTCFVTSVPALASDAPKKSQMFWRDLQDSDDPVEDDEAKWVGHSLPADLVAFHTRRELCEHFMGEVDYDKARRIYLNRKVRQFCTGTDRQLASLRKRYARRKDVIALLRKYEDQVE